MWKSIFNRFMNLFKSKAIAALDNLENPVQMYELAVRESEENIKNMIKAIAMALADQKVRERDLKQAQLESESWMQKAKIALIQKQQELATKALEHKAIAAKKAEEYYALNETLKTKIEDQKKQLGRMQMKHEDLKAKKSIYSAKYETAKAQKHMAESIGGLNNTALAEVNRIEEKINKLEAESEALMELSEGDQTLRTELEESQTAYIVNDELERLQIEVAQEEQEKKERKIKLIEEQFKKSSLSENKNEIVNEFYSQQIKSLNAKNDDKKGMMNDFFNEK